MSTFALGTSAGKVQAFAGALWGITVGSNTMALVNNDIDNLGLNTTLNSYYTAAWGNNTAAQTAATMVANLGITDGADGAKAYVEGQLMAADKAVWGQTISNILSLFNGLVGDATYGAAAAAWVAKQETAVAYTGSDDVAVGSVVSTKTFTLTADVETANGGSGNDTVNAVVGGASATATIADTINLSTGTDTANLRMVDSFDATDTPEFTGVENVVLKVLADAKTADNADLIFPDMTSLTVQHSTLDVTVNGLDYDATTVTLSGTTGDADLDGTGDAASIKLGGQTAGTLTVGTATSATLTLTSDVALTAIAGAATSLTVDGSGDFEATSASVTDVDAAGLTGAVTLTLSAAADKTVTTADGDDSITISGAGDDVISTGAGDDTIDMGTTLTAADEIDGGTGANTLAVTGAGGAVLAASLQVTNIQTLHVTTGGSDSADLDNLAGLTTVLVTSGADAHAIAITNIDGQAIQLENQDDAAKNVLATATLSLADDSGDADSISIKVTNNYDNAAGVEVTTLTADGIETINFEAQETTGATGAAVTITTFDGNAVETLNITGAADVVIAGGEVASAATINASQLDGSLDITVGTADQDITGSAGDDTFTFAGAMTADDTVDGGDGDDTVEVTVNSTGGNATVTLGTITNVETVAVTATQDGAVGETATVDAEGLASGTIEVTGSALNAANTDTIALTKLAAGVEIDVVGNLTNAGVGDYALTAALKTATGDADALTINLTRADGSDQTIDSITVADVETINLTVTADATNGTIDNVVVSALSIDGATSLVVTSEENISLTLSANDSLDTIDLSGATEDIVLDLDTTGDDSGVTITLGNTSAVTNTVAITLNSDDTITDTIVFGDAKIGDVTITNFSVGDGITADVLDLSAYGVTNKSQLTFTDTGADVTIDIAGDADFGLITLVGVANISDINTANFVFAA